MHNSYIISQCGDEIRRTFNKKRTPTLTGERMPPCLAGDCSRHAILPCCPVSWPRVRFHLCMRALAVSLVTRIFDHERMFMPKSWRETVSLEGGVVETDGRTSDVRSVQVRKKVLARVHYGPSV